MEGPPRNPSNPESPLVQKYKLVGGNKVAFEKIATRVSSSVPTGTVIEGILKEPVKTGEPILFENGGQISDVRNIEERNGEVFIETSTSTYRLQHEMPEANQEDFKLEDVETIETSKGSTYRYLPDGTTQRFKKVEGKEYDPQTALVYVPDFAWVKKNAPPDILEKLGENESIYRDILLEYVQNPRGEDRKAYVIDKNGRIIETNEAIKNAGEPIYLAFLKDGHTDFLIPVFHKPKIGFTTFDTRTYADEETGQQMRERHLGNKVVHINLKEKHV
jgi:hypothetical protein